MTMPAVGIDLGTTYSCIAVYRNGSVEVICNEEGSRTTPSYVAFTDTERLVGSAAKNQDSLNSTNTIYDTKRLIGRAFDDPLVQANLSSWPFKVINDCGKPKIVVQYKGKPKHTSPEEISSMVLSKMKEIAEKYLGIRIHKAVITVPAYFNDSQRQATKDAAAIAGLNVLRVLNEPTAAAIAYQFENSDTKNRNILIFDLGGGTFDVSVLSYESGTLKVKSTTGNCHLGGQDFDNRLIDHFLKEILKEHKKDLRTDETVMRRLRNACERAKRDLSVSKEAIIDLDYLFDGISFQSSITRTDFEKLNMDLFQSTITLVEKAVKEAKMKKTDINDIVLIGGSTRIPIVQALLRKCFNGKDLVRSMNLDEAVACGAAIQAAILNGEKFEGNKNLQLEDVTNMCLGINSFQNVLDVIVPRNTPIPVTITKTFRTRSDNDTAVTIEVYEGENPASKDNNFLGKFIIDGIPPAPSGVPQIDVTFQIDSNGILNVTAVERTTKITKSIETVSDGRLTRNEIREMVTNARKYEHEDYWKTGSIETKNDLERLCFDTKAKLDEIAGSARKEDVQKLLDKCNQVLRWINEKPSASKFDYFRRSLEIRHLSEFMK